MKAPRDGNVMDGIGDDELQICQFRRSTLNIGGFVSVDNNVTPERGASRFTRP